MENTKKHAQTRSLNSSRSNKILGLLQINVQGNVKQDPIKTRAKKTEEKTAFRPKEEKSYVELFDRGEWEDLDACLRKNPLGKNLKRKQPWGNEYIDGNYRPTEHDKSRPSKFRKSLFDCATPVCATTASVHTETLACAIPGSVHTETSACTIPGSVYTETSACTIPGSVYTETSACTIAGSVHTETSACTIPASVHTETSACTIPGSVYTEMSACTIPASVHTVTSACTIPASVHTETSACTIPGSVYTEKSACAIPGSVYTETSVCTIPASVYTETSACTIPSSVYTEMSACTIPASVHTETSACTIPASVHTETSACTIPGSVYTEKSACAIPGSVYTETSVCTIPASVYTETSACTIPSSVYTETSACTIPASVHTVTSACTIPASVHTETSACTIPGSVYTEKSACAIPGSVYTETSVCTIPASVYTETSACTIPSSVYTEMSACTIPASVHTETSACTIPGSVYTVTSACTIAGSVHTVTSACTIAGSVHTETSACPISASVHTSPVSTYLSTNFETNTWGNISKNFPSTPNCNKYNTKGNWTNIKTTFPESPKSSPVKNSNLKRPNKYHNPLKDLNFTSPITKKMSPVSQHNTNTTPPPCIETINNMPNNSFVIMEIPVSSQFELFKKTNPPNVSSEHNIQQKKICHIDISEPINEEMNSKNKRKWDRKNFCLYCKKLITNFSKHMTKIHSNEESVMKYCAILDSDLKIRKQRRQAIFDELRKQGNFLYNQQVLRESITPPTQSMLLPVKRSSSGTNDRMTSHIHCKVCLGLFSRKTFYRHASQCGNENKNDEEDILPAKNSYVKEKGLELNLCSDQASEILKEKIFPLLRKDQKGIAAVTDPLIVSIASDFLSNHTSNKDKYHVTNKMRDAGALLLKMKEKDPTILNFQDCFDVKQIDNMISSVQEMSQSNLPSGTVGVVGMPARLSWVIHESCSKIIDNIITNQSLTDNYKDSLKRKVMDFQSVIRRRWKYCISTNAEKTRKINAMKKAVVMPDDHDIKLFLEEITYLEQEFSNKLRVTPSVEHYEHLCEAVIAKLIVLNRRRSGEVANAELEFYINRREGTTSDEVLNQLSHDEKSTLEMFEVFLIPGKIVRAVPILFSKTTAQNIDLIISCRTKLGIPQSNQLLFARPGTENPFIGANVIRKIRNSLQLKKPAHMTATGLRHHCATMSHVISKTLDKEDLAEFMGHTLEIHKKKYRYPLDVIQRGKIGPHLIKLGGVHLNELESANEDIMNEDNCDDVQHWHNNDNEDWRNDNDEDWQPDNAEDWHNDDEEDHHTNIKHKRKTRTRWTEEEKLIVIESFKEFIKSCRNPGKKLCTELILKESLLKNRTWAQVNVLVDNYNKGKVALPMQYQYLRNC